MKRLSVYRLVAILLLLFLLVSALYLGRTFLVPLAFAIVLAMLLRPVANWLEGKGVGRILSSLLCLLLVLLFVAAFCGILYAQAVSIANDWPSIKPKLEQGITMAQQWIAQQFGLDPKQQLESAKSGLSKLSQSSGSGIMGFLGGFSGFLTGFVLALLYLFFLLWKREKYREFLLRLAEPENRSVMDHALDQITHVSAQYLVGRLISMLFLAVFYIIGLSILGLENAILISLVAVIPTLIPYVGAFIGATFPLFMALVSGSADQLFPTAAVLVTAQVIDNNLIEPIVMGKELDLSPIFTIIAIVLGELIWGVAGMILFEPLFAIIKIVCDHVPALNPYGFLLGDDTEEAEWLQKIKGWFSRKS